MCSGAAASFAFPRVCCGWFFPPFFVPRFGAASGRCVSSVRAFVAFVAVVPFGRGVSAGLALGVVLPDGVALGGRGVRLGCAGGGFVSGVSSPSFSVWGCSSCCSSVLFFVLRAVGLAGAGWRFALPVRFALGLAGSSLAGLCLVRGRWCPCFVPPFGWSRALCGCVFLALRFRCLSVALRLAWLGLRCCWVGVVFLLGRFLPFALVAGCGLSVLPLSLGVLAWSRSSGCGRCFRPLGGRAAQLGEKGGGKMKLSKAYEQIIHCAIKNIAHWTECLEDAVERGDRKSQDFWLDALDTERKIIDKYAAALEEIKAGKQKDYEIGGFNNENNTKSNE